MQVNCCEPKCIFTLITLDFLDVFLYLEPQKTLVSNGPPEIIQSNSLLRAQPQIWLFGVLSSQLSPGLFAVRGILPLLQATILIFIFSSEECFPQSSCCLCPLPVHPCEKSTSIFSVLLGLEPHLNFSTFCVLELQICTLFTGVWNLLEKSNKNRNTVQAKTKYFQSIGIVMCY